MACHLDESLAELFSVTSEDLFGHMTFGVPLQAVFPSVRWNVQPGEGDGRLRSFVFNRMTFRVHFQALLRNVHPDGDGRLQGLF